MVTWEELFRKVEILKKIEELELEITKAKKIKNIQRIKTLQLLIKKLKGGIDGNDKTNM